MQDWIVDHLETLAAAVVSFFLGVWGTGKLFVGLRRDVEEMKGKVESHSSAIDKLEESQARAEEQRAAIKENTDKILTHLLNSKDSQ